MDETDKAGLAAVIIGGISIFIIATVLILALDGCAKEFEETRLGQKIEYWIG